jgi:mRNA interferase HigB
MKILNQSKISAFTKKHPQYTTTLNTWHTICRNTNFNHFAELRNVLSNSVDVVGKCTVFNIHGNDVRLIAKVYYTQQRIFIQDVLTHAEYEKGKWKDNCKRK